MFARATKLATKCESRFKSERGARWRQRVAEAVSQGGGKAHKHSKPAVGWIPSVSLEGPPPPGPQQQVDELLNFWIQ
eukprot:1401219-Pyramimonas_sp.AAC.1